MPSLETNLALSSTLIRVASYGALTEPHLLPWRVLSYLIPVIYGLSLPAWLQLPLQSYPRETKVEVGVKEVSVDPEGNGEYPMKRVKQDITLVQLQRPRPLPRPGVARLVLGYPTRNRASNIATLLINTLLTLAVLDQMLSPELLLQQKDQVYARASTLTPHTSTIKFRLPSTEDTSTARIAFRPLLAPEALAEASPVPWQLSQTVTLSKGEDWEGKVGLEGLHSGMTYEYQAIAGDQDLSNLDSSSSHNFTTFPESRLSGLDAGHFRFVHAGTPKYYAQPCRPLSILPPLLPLHTPYTSFSPSHMLHRWRAHHLRQPAWRVLSDWLADMRERTAWAQVKFGLLDSEVELAGAKILPMGFHNQQRNARQFLASRDVRDTLEILPVLPCSVYSPSEGSIVEPGALSSPETSFNYADTQFYRLRRPFIEHGEEEAADWRVDLGDLRAWLAGLNTTHGFKFILTPVSLAPWFDAKLHVEAWREAVLDVLAYTPNVVVLAQSSHGFVASTLRRTVVEFASPPLNSPPIPRWWSGRKRVLPDLSKARTEALSTWGKRDGEVVEVFEMDTVDRLLNYIPISPGARWTSIEIDPHGRQPRAIVLAFEKGVPVWRMEVVGVKGRRDMKASRALGGVAEGFGSMLRRLGLLGARWF